MVKFIIEQADVMDVPSDLLLLKYAQRFYGADLAVASRLVSLGLCKEADLKPEPGDCVVVESKGSIAPYRVIFLGTAPLHRFKYDEMELFAQWAIEKIANRGLLAKTLTTTVHGTGYGLDGGESLQRLIMGFVKGLSRYEIPVNEIIFLTLGKRAERMLTSVLNTMDIMDDSKIRSDIHPSTEQPSHGSEQIVGALTRKQRETSKVDDGVSVSQVEKTRVFIAMPFSEEFENVYEFGIYPAVRNCGLICERVDESHFVGDILSRIREGIESASLVVADLTEGRPNVYLEVGYAWGKGVPVIFVARKGEKLHFDVSTHRCIFYGRFKQFAKDLEDLIRGIQDSFRI